MEITTGILIGAIVVVITLFILFEYRIRKPDVLLLYEYDIQTRKTT